eukprot:GHRQ01033237.1.p1 GENE.GHRQ01033237.1~~GHRQ01033237.1.p1  ORF type:complete len:162 (+),score=11.15 GHRQ01033237.1:285-770(+)
MAATSTRSKNTISLKGSAAIVAEYFNYAVNNILYQRGIYPTDSFRQEQHYGLSIMVSKDQGLTAYLQTVTQQMSSTLCQVMFSMLNMINRYAHAAGGQRVHAFAYNRQGSMRLPSCSQPAMSCPASCCFLTSIAVLHLQAEEHSAFIACLQHGWRMARCSG